MEARQCAHWIHRKDRRCAALVVQAGEQYCSQHVPDALRQARERSLAALRQLEAERDRPDLAPSREARRRYRRLESRHLSSRPSPADEPAPPAAAPLSFADPLLPLHLDVGCARGRWVASLASSPRWRANHLGVEIRGELVRQAAEAARAAGVDGSVQYAHADMATPNVARAALLAAARRRLAAVSVLFPDPHDARRTRQTLTPSLAAALAAHLRPGGVVCVASDVAAVADDMRRVLLGVMDPLRVARFDELRDDEELDAALDAALRGPAGATRAAKGGGGGIGRNPWRVPTEREAVCEQRDRHGGVREVYRYAFVRAAAAVAWRREGRAAFATAASGAAQPGGAAGFYNPRMRLNRELCLLELEALLSAGAYEPRAGASEGLGAAGAPVRLCDAFTAAGVLALRLAAEVAPACSRQLQLVLADVEPDCAVLACANLRASRVAARLRAVGVVEEGCSPSIDALERRVEELEEELRAHAEAAAGEAAGENGVPPGEEGREASGEEGGEEAEAACASSTPPAALDVTVICADARALAYILPPFEYAHLDPFGSCAPHADAFCSRAPHGGVLSFTATDTSALYALYPNVSWRTYAARLERRDPNWREAGVRALVGSIAHAAARHGRGVGVLHAVSAAHFVHVVVRVRRGAAAADASASLVDIATTPDGAQLGPLWLGPLNDAAFLKNALAAARRAQKRGEGDRSSKADIEAIKQVVAIFQRSLEDAPSLPPFSVQVNSASPASVVAELTARGYTASRSAFCGDAAKAGSGNRVRTNAPEHILRELGVVTSQKK
ncbi:hypothetical protein AB1Y20_017374 [Prymnesium parvum]|uniref:Zinc finger CCCH-type TRM13 domain-containing protein n=1 Tax=Prymnesium parvum TaxID=97485 RepID=A0AB34JP75_PRYPA